MNIIKTQLCGLFHTNGIKGFTNHHRKFRGKLRIPTEIQYILSKFKSMNTNNTRGYPINKIQEL